MALDDATGKPMVPLPPGVALRFQLVLKNDDFALFTDLTGISAKVIQVAGQTARAPLFTNAGMAAGTAGDLQLVSDNAPCAPGVFAGVEIRYSAPSAGAVAPVFRVALQARQWRWAYYCITDLQPDAKPLAIVDKASSDVLVFGAGQTPGASDPIAAQIASRYPAMRCVQMLTDKAVACREEPRKQLELRHGTDRLTGPLPNPSLRQVVRLSSTQDVLFQIVKYRTDPFNNP